MSKIYGNSDVNVSVADYTIAVSCLAQLRENIKRHVKTDRSFQNFTPNRPATETLVKLLCSNLGIDMSNRSTPIDIYDYDNLAEVGSYDLVNEFTHIAHFNNVNPYICVASTNANGVKFSEFKIGTLPNLEIMAVTTIGAITELAVVQTALFAIDHERHIALCGSIENKVNYHYPCDLPTHIPSAAVDFKTSVDCFKWMGRDKYGLRHSVGDELLLLSDMDICVKTPEQYADYVLESITEEMGNECNLEKHIRRIKEIIKDEYIDSFVMNTTSRLRFFKLYVNMTAQPYHFNSAFLKYSLSSLDTSKYFKEL